MALEGWPPQAGTERSARILEAVKAGRYEIQWCPVDVEDLRVLVSCDALKIDGVRVNVDARTQQLIADEIGAVLLTPKLADEIYQRATRLDPKPQTITSSTQAMIAHSGRVDAQIALKNASGLVADVGKDWVIVKSIFSQTARAARKSANYGWHVPTKRYQGLNAEGAVTPGLFTIQGVGTAHDSSHVDYSQVARFALRSARYGELPVDLANVYTGEAPGNELVSHEGPLPNFRQPGADEPPSPAVPPAGGSSSGVRKRPSGVKTALGGAAAGALALAAGAGPFGIAAATLIGGILGRKA
jgi:hypothetical protein